MLKFNIVEIHNAHTIGPSFITLHLILNKDITTTLRYEYDESVINYLHLSVFKKILAAKYRISTPLMMEKPVRSPMVPPTADNMSTNFAALSLVILSNVGVSKKILTKWRLFFHSRPKMYLTLLFIQLLLLLYHSQTDFQLFSCICHNCPGV